MKPAVLVVIVLAVILVVAGVAFTANNRYSSTESVPTPTVSKTPQDALTPEERTQILAASTQIVTANTEKGYKYSLSIKKRVGDYVRVDVTPAKGEMIDPAQVILQKKNSAWTAITFGTSFPDLYDKVPELFK